MPTCVEGVESGFSDLGSNAILNNLIENSHFYITIVKEVKTKGKRQCFHLGNISLELTTADAVQLNDEPPLCDECYLYVNPDVSRHMLYYEFFENDENLPSTSQDRTSRKAVCYYLVQSDVPNSCLESLQVICCYLIEI